MPSTPFLTVGCAHLWCAWHKAVCVPLLHGLDCHITANAWAHLPPHRTPSTHTRNHGATPPPPLLPFQGHLEGSLLYTAAYLRSVKAQLRGALRGVSQPTTLPAIAKVCGGGPQHAAAGGSGGAVYWYSLTAAGMGSGFSHRQ